MDYRISLQVFNIRKTLNSQKVFYEIRVGLANVYFRVTPLNLVVPHILHGLCEEINPLVEQYLNNNQTVLVL